MTTLNDVEPLISNPQLYGSISGALGVVFTVESSRNGLFEFLLAVQKQMQLSVTPLGNLSHQTYRSQLINVTSKISQRFVDGDLVESYPELPADIKKKIASKLMIPVICFI